MKSSHRSETTRMKSASHHSICLRPLIGVLLLCSLLLQARAEELPLDLINADDQKRLLRNFRTFPRAQIARGKWSKWKTEFLRSLRQAVILRNPQRADDSIQDLGTSGPSRLLAQTPG